MWSGVTVAHANSRKSRTEEACIAGRSLRYFILGAVLIETSLIPGVFLAISPNR